MILVAASDAFMNWLSFMAIVYIQSVWSLSNVFKVVLKAAKVAGGKAEKASKGDRQGQKLAS